MHYVDQELPFRVIRSEKIFFMHVRQNDITGLTQRTWTKLLQSVAQPGGLRRLTFHNHENVRVETA